MIVYKLAASNIHILSVLKEVISNPKFNELTNEEIVEKLEKVPTNRYVKQLTLGGDVFQPSYNGYISDLRIYNEAKDYEFIKELFDSYINKEGFTSEFSDM